MEKISFFNDLNMTIAEIDKSINIEDKFDIVKKSFSVGERPGVLYYVEGMLKDEVIQKILQEFAGIKKEDCPNSSGEFLKKCISYVDVKEIKAVSDFHFQLFSGLTCMVIQGLDSVFAVDARSYPQRSIEEPEKDKVMRGSRDGFVETVILNTAMIRRRIRDKRLAMKYFEVGKITRTDVVVCYMSDRVDKELLKRITDKIKNLDVECLNMNQESLAEYLYSRRWINPFPKFKYTERPDTTAASLTQGSIAILVDNSPSAMIIPSNIFDIVEEADDFYFPPVTGTYLRATRFITNILAVVLTPLYLLMMLNPEWLPESMNFILIQEEVFVPVIWQFLILEFAIDGLKMASLNTPAMLNLPLSVIAALVIGDFAAQSGWFNSEIMLYMAFVILANYTQANYELGYALKFMRIISLILTWYFNIYGFVAGMLVTLLSLAFNRTLAGKSYLYPVIPFNGKKLLKKLFRVSFKHNKA